MADMIISIVFVTIIAIALFVNEEKIAKWQDKFSKR